MAYKKWGCKRFNNIYCMPLNISVNKTLIVLILYSVLYTNMDSVFPLMFKKLKYIHVDLHGTTVSKTHSVSWRTSVLLNFLSWKIPLWKCIHVVSNFKKDISITVDMEWKVWRPCNEGFFKTLLMPSWMHSFEMLALKLQYVEYFVNIEMLELIAF